MTAGARSSRTGRPYGWLAALVAGASLLGALGLAGRSNEPPPLSSARRADQERVAPPSSTATPVLLARATGTSQVTALGTTAASGLPLVAAPGPVTAAPPFVNAAVELDALRSRLPGERVASKNRARSLDAIARALDGELDGAARAELETRRARLERKQREHAESMAQLEERISRLEQP